MVGGLWFSDTDTLGDVSRAGQTGRELSLTRARYLPGLELWGRVDANVADIGTHKERARGQRTTLAPLTLSAEAQAGRPDWAADDGAAARPSILDGEEAGSAEGILPMTRRVVFPGPD